MEFLAIYVREAHPTDGWRRRLNDKDGGCFAQPKSLKERTAVASVCCEKLKITMPLLVDDVDDRVGHLYSGMPDRLYLIDRAGKVAYKGGREQFGFKPGELEQAIILNALETRPAVSVDKGTTPSGGKKPGVTPGASPPDGKSPGAAMLQQELRMTVIPWQNNSH